MAGHATLTCDEFMDLAAAVALDAADPDDVERVEEHAAECQECGRWLDEFRSTAAAMALSVPQLDPPPALRTRVFDTVSREPRPLPIVRRLWPPSVGSRRRRFSAAWLVAAASFFIAVASLAWVAMLQAQISDLLMEDRSYPSGRQKRVRHFARARRSSSR